MTTKLTSLSAGQMREALLSKKVSAVELTQAHLDRIEKTNTELNCFIRTCPTKALNAAKDAQRAIHTYGGSTPLLTGIPVGIKDMLVTKGIETTCASRILQGFIPPYNCTAVSKLEEAGAIVLGKTNLDEFAMGSSNENSAYGNVKNPWDKTRVPGGSSGGSAACVASGQAPISLGTDTGGSIRQPAALCGIVGLKPTWGRVSRYGAVAFASSLDQIGPFGRCIRDVALALAAISGKDECDSTSLNVPVEDYVEAAEKTDFLKGKKIGVSPEFFGSGINNEIKNVVNKAIDNAQDAGAEIVEVHLPHIEYAISTYYIIAPAEASSNLARYDGVRYGKRTKKPENLQSMYARTRGEGFGREVKRRIMIGSHVLSTGYYEAYYEKAQRVRTMIIKNFDQAFANCDFIAAPATPTTAFKLGENIKDPLKMYVADILTIPANLAGLPALSMPCGLDSQGLPIGLQLIGPSLSEATLISAGVSFESILKFDATKYTAGKL